MKTNTKRIVIASMFAALTCIATMTIKVPSPLNGYLNLGDGVVLISGWLLSPAYAFLSAGIGSALADAFSGYFVYVPATFIIKATMSLVAHFTFKFLHKKMANVISRVISGVFAELLMVLGYFIFEGFMYGFAPSVVNIPANSMQGVAGIIIGLIFVKAFEKTKLF